MKKFLLELFIVLNVVLVFFACDGRKFNLPKENLYIEKSSGEKVNIEVELAIKPEERNYGYMNRKRIPEGTGMLFVFEKDQILSFWMKDTPSPLSIAYIDRTGKIVDIYDMTPFSLASITSSRSVRYALEVPQSWYEKNGIKKGDVLKLKK